MKDKIKKIPKEEWESCPHCDNSGELGVTIAGVRIDKNGEPEAYPTVKTIKCKFCWENYKSVFNQIRIREK